MGLWTGRLAGVGLIITSLFVAVLGYVILHFCSMILSKRGADYDDPSAFVLACIEHPWWTIIAALPALVCGIALMKFKPKPRVLWIMIGALAALAPLAVILYCFIMLLAPLYQVQPL